MHLLALQLLELRRRGHSGYDLWRDGVRLWPTTFAAYYQALAIAKAL